MPRKSAAALSIVQPLPGQKRPEPPSELTDEQADEWRAVVDRLPPDWFPRESHALLIAYCRHVVKARVIEGWINDVGWEGVDTDEGLRRFDKLTAMAEREGRAISSLATRMRLSQQSRYAHKTANAKAADPKASQKQWECVA
jgi:hypothetical protein